MLAIGAVIGAGIFTSIGTAAAGHIGPDGEVIRLAAGPAMVFSFVIVGIACGFAALCYAEMASMIPQAGSAYAYSYATLGEFIAWIIGWDLILEYAVGNVYVAIAWSGYFVSLLSPLGISFPPWLVHGYREVTQSSDPALQGLLQTAPHIAGIPILINLPAFLIVMAVTALLYVGVKETKRANNIIVGIKLAVIGLFVIVGALHIDVANYTPFAPNGFEGIAAGAGVIFFAYIGFDAISTAGEETKDPQRTLPRGIMWGLLICTVIYIVMGIVATGIVPYSQLAASDPLAAAFSIAGLTKLSWVIAFGAVISMTAVLLVFQYGQPRIFMSMARDGLLPAWASRIHPRFKTPHVTTVVTGLLVGMWALIGDGNEVADLTSIGTLFAFSLVCIGVLILRHVDPRRPRPFRVRWVWLVALLGTGSCVWVMLQLPGAAWKRFAIWLVLGLVIYAWYGYWHSKMRRSEDS
jgi:APA family basic amino acid/polyamine antiporter